MANAEQQLLAWSFDPTLPIVLLYNKVDDLMDLVNAAGSPYSAQQIINLAYILLNKMGKFTTGICEWNRIPQAQRTWDAFQLHFSQAHRELRELGELELRETPFNTANIVQEVIEWVQQVLQPAMEASYEAETADVLHHANAATPAPTLQTTLLMEQILHMIQIMQQQLQQKNSKNNTASHNNMTRVRTKIDKYCWTHRACAHSSAECRNKKVGHKKDAASFSNMQGGCTDFVNTSN